ncbi:hypothetical protein ACFQUU_04990 [Herbaspirillum sp. GCM10030257]|uniref:hypothetical protein n=1 Tax=Herbaspirillum sp. GCM10030257 TaxID=3273393 RepID=UPI00360B5D8A
MLSLHNADPAASQNDKATEVQKFIKEISFLIESYSEVQDSSVRRAVKELKDVKACLEQGNQRRSRDWGATGKNLLLAAQWVKIICDFLQE